MDKDIETLATALYVKIDDMLADWPDLAPARPATGIPLTLSDAELLTMAVMSALLGFTSERRWLRFVNKDLAQMFPRRIGQSGYNKRLRKAFFLFIRVIRMLAMDTSLWSDDVWVVDSTPVQCGCSTIGCKSHCGGKSRGASSFATWQICSMNRFPMNLSNE